MRVAPQRARVRARFFCLSPPAQLRALFHGHLSLLITITLTLTRSLAVTLTVVVHLCGQLYAVGIVLV